MDKGSIIVYTGPMFSGKSEMLTGRLRSRQRARKKVLCIKPLIDSRYSTNEIVSKRLHEDGANFAPDKKFPAFPVDIQTCNMLSDLIESSKCEVLGVDEAQFFDVWLARFLDLRRDQGLEIHVAGLDLDAWRLPFGCMPQIFAYADVVQKFTADCFVCGQPARFTQKKGGSSEQIQVGAENLYEARCESCWTPAA